MASTLESRATKVVQQLNLYIHNEGLSIPKLPLLGRTIEVSPQTGGKRISIDFPIDGLADNGKSNISIVLYEGTTSGKTYAVKWYTLGKTNPSYFLGRWENEPHDEGEYRTTTEPKHWHWNPLNPKDRASDIHMVEPENILKVINEILPDNYKNSVIAGTTVTFEGEIEPAKLSPTTGSSEFAP